MAVVLDAVEHSAPAPAAQPAAAPSAANATPDGFDPRRRLGAEEYAEKAEGGYFTGLPLVNYDSNTGVGFGARGYYFFDGQRSDPRFAYTPYLYRIFLQAFATTGGYQFHWLDVDARNVLGSAFTFRGALIFQRNIDQHYFGIGSRSMRELSGPGPSSRYYSYQLTQPMLLLALERPLLRGVLRPFVGLGLSYNDIEQRIDEEPTSLSDDCAAGAIVGCGGGWNDFLRLGIAFDTRDFEPDPNRGVLIDAALDVGTVLLGSEYAWVRGMVAARSYLSLLPGLTDLVLATRLTFVVQSSDTPFFAMNWIPYLEDPRQGLGGLRTLRGYKQDRFVGPVMTLANAELRWTFARSEPLGQSFAWMVVPFVDAGRVDDRVGDVELDGTRANWGLALRAAWNLATVITVEYAKSPEDSGTYVNFNHIF
jgi:outer membrane protein assembly factor BamA